MEREGQQWMMLTLLYQSESDEHERTLPGEREKLIPSLMIIVGMYVSTVAGRSKWTY